VIRISMSEQRRFESGYEFNRWEDDEAFMETVRRFAGFKPLTFGRLTAEKA